MPERFGGGCSGHGVAEDCNCKFNIGALRIACAMLGGFLIYLKFDIGALRTTCAMSGGLLITITVYYIP